jgi:hypothetical protein
MNNIERIAPVSLAIMFGLLAVLGLLFIPALANTLTGWASFLAAVALLLGILNLIGVHARRAVKRNAYSVLLLLSMLAMFALAISDFIGATDQGVEFIFGRVLAPLEAAMASLLAFFLLFAGIRLLQRQRNWWAVLFLATVVLILLGRTPLPGFLGDVFGGISNFINTVFVNAGMRGILIGVALGAITISIRVIMGWERPYDK